MRNLAPLFALVLTMCGCHGAAEHPIKADHHDAPGNAESTSEHATATHGVLEHGDTGHVEAAHPVTHEAKAAHHELAPSAPLPIPFGKGDKEHEVAKAFLHTMFKDNEAFVAANPATHFADFVAGQKPRATVIACADSRVQANAFDHSPENDLFTIRNIGNQFKTAAGSVMYGVEHLDTSVLLILGHSGCGAVKAALTDHSKLEKPIKDEVDQIVVPPMDAKLSPEDQLTKAVVSNVHDQVKEAIHHFADRVQSGKLVIVGAVYDFRNDLKHGQGRIIVVNVNGQTDPAVLSTVANAVL